MENSTMSRDCVTAVLAIVLFSAAVPVSAQTDVDKRLDDLERRVKALESGNQHTQRATSHTRSAWRQLSKGMSREQVRALLGEPDRINGGTFERWRWTSGGEIIFYQGAVDGWSEPG
jgi:outer membrane protein assembly factor BamE (lipoprotein component of BamABCDE complex)